MTITGHQIDPNWSGSASLDGGETFSVNYTVYSDDSADGPRTVIAYCEANIAPRRASYAIGNDVDTNSYVQSIEPVRQPGSKPSAVVWRVAYNYGPNSDTEERPDPGGTPTPDPVNWQPEYTCYFASRSIDLEQALFLGAYEKDNSGTRSACPVSHNGNNFAGPPIPLNTVVPVTNSALDPFDPPIQSEDWDFIFRVTHWLTAWDTNYKPFQGSVNEFQFTITDAAVGVAETFAVDTARLNIGAALNRINNLWRWEITWEFVVREEGWYDRIPDRGFHPWAGPGAPKPGGGSFTAADPGRPCKRPMIMIEDPETKQRLPVSEPARLNGSGQPVDTTELQNCDDLWVLEYLKPKRRDFSTLPIPGIA